MMCVCVYIYEYICVKIIIKLPKINVRTKSKAIREKKALTSSGTKLRMRGKYLIKNNANHKVITSFKVLNAKKKSQLRLPRQ